MLLYYAVPLHAAYTILPLLPGLLWWPYEETTHVPTVCYLGNGSTVAPQVRPMRRCIL